MPENLNSKDDLKGVYDPITGQVWLIADNIEPGTERGVFLHDVGIHAALSQEDFFQDILSQVNNLKDTANHYKSARDNRAVLSVGEKDYA
ncbi:MAG: hypothetical protein KZQ83_08930 [gamma proteobacterium symbiont of Taylorina sp.]|nr:hypothetical protein [gamma proteobacterium symbiont of Taylorina sp.]